MTLSPGNKALHGRVWAAAKGLPRIGYWQALDRLLDAARAEGRAVALAEAADYATFYGEERLRLAGDSILHDPVLSAARGSMVTRADLAQSREMQVDGTINSAGYHAATHIAEHLRALADAEAVTRIDRHPRLALLLGLALALFFGVVIPLAIYVATGPGDCAAYAEQHGRETRWVFWGGCQVRDGRAWVSSRGYVRPFTVPGASQ